VRYCGVTLGSTHHVLCELREALDSDPPVRLEAHFYEPGDVQAVAHNLLSGDEAVIAISSPLGPPAGGRERRVADEELESRGVPALPFSAEGQALFGELADLGLYAPGSAGLSGGRVEDGSFQMAPVIETNVEAVFCALQGRRLPARRHPLGIRRRIEELSHDHVVDMRGGLWNRRIEEVEAAAAALCAHRYAVGHASWLGDPAEGVVVLPGIEPPGAFGTDGVLPSVERLPLG
jgi:predicted nuclease with RNAse H fold